MSTVYTDDQVVTVRTEQLAAGMLRARGRDQQSGGYTAVRIDRAGWAGWAADWQAEVWRVELADGTTFAQPGHFPVCVVRDGVA